MVLLPRAGRHDPASGLRQPGEGPEFSAPRTRAVELEGAGEGQRSGGAGGGRGGRLGAEAGPPVPSLCSLTLTAPRCAEWSGKQRSRVGRGVSWARESPRLAARRSRLEEAQVSLEFQPRSQRLRPEHLV